MEILTQIIEIFIEGVTQIAGGLGSGLSAIAKDIFIVETVTGDVVTQDLSVLGSLVVIFGSISLALGLFRWILNFLTSLGERNR